MPFYYDNFKLLLLAKVPVLREEYFLKISYTDIIKLFTYYNSLMDIYIYIHYH
jgi:hypothetical protein